MTISPEDFGKLFAGFQQEAFRLETLDDYGQSGGVEAYQDFLAGKPRPEGYESAPWTEKVRRATDAGKRMYRVHILARPLTKYLQYELSWGYRRNMTAGEEFFILDTTEQENPLRGVPDFWAFDERSVACMSYDDAGKFLGAELRPAGEAAQWMERRDVALRHAVPFAEWWDRYGTE
ncbi:DUF6879 family protein [Streptomyces pinistramenti]|uniref:DUF6879 family protein n=1 Tax=Streptomyces pinistramenti TaxID=2884812 RepID=UPI001D062614|nr:DUF6879 family protein [Streptomyces pinistramenti]MCB5907868.1 hypothetical protein [Streptomyces pinistramenti]